MNISRLLAIVVVASLIANFMHWSGRKDEPFLRYPKSGFLGFLFRAGIVTTFAVAVLFLAGSIERPVFPGMAFGMTIALSWYSMVRRRVQRMRL